MPALYTITTRASGTILTAAIYNADHQNHVNNGDAAHLGAFSANTSQMRTQTSPGDVGSESLALSIADELARIRYMIALQRGTTFWYGTTRAAADGLNYFRNSDFLTLQRQGQGARAYAASAGEPYTADCWYVHNGVGQAMTILPGNPLGASKSIQSLIMQRNAGQTGITQMWVGHPFTLAQLAALRGSQVTVSFKWQTGATFAGTNFSTVLSTGTGASAAKITGFSGRVDQALGSLSVGSSQSGTFVGTSPAIVPANATQMDFLILWTPLGTAGATDWLAIGDIKLEVGLYATPYVNPDPYEELDELATFYWKTFPLGITPAQNAGSTGCYLFPPQTVAASTAAGQNGLRFPKRMTKAPTITLYNPSAANALARNTTVPADAAATTVGTVNETSVNLAYTSAIGSAATNNNLLHVEADAGV